MKKIFTLLFFATLMMAVRAQIPNSSFEFWTNGPNSDPDGWRSGSSVAQQSTDHVAGAYSVKIQTTIITNDTSRGQIETGGVADTSGGPKPNFAVSQRHTSFKGYYKYTPLNGDSAQLGCMVFKTGFSSGFPGAPAGMLGIAFSTFGGAVSTFTPFSIDFSYLDSTQNFTPDSGWVILASYVFFRGTNQNLRPQGNSALYVDALSFDNYATGINEVNDITSSFYVFPNVSNGQFELHYELKEDGYVTLKIYDMDGREMRNLGSGNFTAGLYSQSYNVSGLANGEYLMVLGGENGFHSEKLIIMK